jgi:hypothetical protein
MGWVLVVYTLYKEKYNSCSRRLEYTSPHGVIPISSRSMMACVSLGAVSDGGGGLRELLVVVVRERLVPVMVVWTRVVVVVVGGWWPGVRSNV